MNPGVDAIGAVQRGRDAFERREWADAHALLSAAREHAPLAAPDLELLAASAYLTGHDEVSDDAWAAAHNEYLRAHDAPRAARCAFWLALALVNRGEDAPASGWIARALRLLDERGSDCAERGLLLVLSARLYFRRRDVLSGAAAVQQVVEIASRFDDRELKVFGNLIQGQLRARNGEVAQAAALFDEAMVAVTLGDVSPVGVGVVYCAVIDACHGIFDVKRAREWTAALSRWCDPQRDLVAFRGNCLVHRAEILRLSGAWSNALAEAEHACTWLSELAQREDGAKAGEPLPSFKYPIGAAYYELAELHRMRGDFDRAEDCYRSASRHGRSPEPGLALLRMMQGQYRAASAAIQRVVAQPLSWFARAGALAAAAEIMIEVHDVTAARAAAEELGSMAARADVPYLRALRDRAAGSVSLADGDAHAALGALRASWKEWQEIEAPYEAARVRVLLALTYRALGDDDTAELELDAAHRVFERLGAAPEIQRVEQLTTVAQRPSGGGLTPREREVIVLLATGKTNRAIARQLAISERTVDRHVSNILLKLELPSRSAATAYAYEHGLAH